MLMKLTQGVTFANFLQAGFCTEVFYTAFMSQQIGFVIRICISAKAASKMFNLVICIGSLKMRFFSFQESNCGCGLLYRAKNISL